MVLGSRRVGRGNLSDHDRAGVDRDSRPEAVERLETDILEHGSLGPRRARPREDVGRAPALDPAARLSHDRGVTLESDRPARHPVVPQVAQVEPCLLGPGRAGPDEEVCGSAEVGTGRAVVRRADQGRVAVDGYGVAEVVERPPVVGTRRACSDQVPSANTYTVAEPGALAGSVVSGRADHQRVPAQRDGPAELCVRRKVSLERDRHRVRRDGPTGCGRREPG